jgi:hypothetical protein
MVTGFSCNGFFLHSNAALGSGNIYAGNHNNDLLSDKAPASHREASSNERLVKPSAFYYKATGKTTNHPHINARNKFYFVTRLHSD